MLKFQDNPHLSHHLAYHRYNEGDDEDVYPETNKAADTSYDSLPREAYKSPQPFTAPANETEDDDDDKDAYDNEQYGKE